MKKLVLSVVMTVLTVCGLFGAAVLAPTDGVYAANSGLGNVTEYTKNSNQGNETDLMKILKNGINVVLGVVGVIAVVMIVIGGINYSTSQGDSGKVKKAKDTILYGILGLVVALLAFAIVNFVLTGVFG